MIIFFEVIKWSSLLPVIELYMDLQRSLNQAFTSSEHFSIKKSHPWIKRVAQNTKLLPQKWVQGFLLLAPNKNYFFWVQNRYLEKIDRSFQMTRFLFPHSSSQSSTDVELDRALILEPGPKTRACRIWARHLKTFEPSLSLMLPQNLRSFRLQNETQTFSFWNHSDQKVWQKAGPGCSGL